MLGKLNIIEARYDELALVIADPEVINVRRNGRRWLRNMLL